MDNKGLIVVSDAEDLARDYYKEFATYANSTRALASPIDGCKLVYRRVLWSSLSQPKDKMMKSAVIVGETMRYHPHGEQPGVLYSLVRSKMGLYDKQGNFGTDFLAGAAPRYTECRINDIARAWLGGDLIDYCDMEEGELGYMEPTYLPALIPFILTEGSSSMGLGMKAEIPRLKIRDLIKYFRAQLTGEPDPVVRLESGDVDYLHTTAEVDEAVKSGKMTRMRCHSTIKSDGERIVTLSALPDKITKSNVLGKVGKWIKDDLLDFRDESTSELRFVFEVVDPKKLSVAEVEARLKKATSKSNSYEYVMTHEGKIKYMRLDQIRTQVLDYLIKVINRKFSVLIQKSESDLEVMLVIRHIQDTNLIDRIKTMSVSEVVDEIKAKTEYSESSIKIAMTKSISYLTKGTSEEIAKIEQKLSALKVLSSDPEGYLVNLYDRFDSLLAPNLDKSTYLDSEIAKLYFRLEGGQMIVSTEKTPDSYECEKQYIALTARGDVQRVVVQVTEGVFPSEFVAVSPACQGRRYLAIRQNRVSGVSFDESLIKSGKTVRLDQITEDYQYLVMLEEDNKIRGSQGSCSSNSSLRKSRVKAKPTTFVNEGYLI